ncbi:MAG TPA: tetratricopeptide repeat protein [Saprospiraceae bacterium]|nr:tetratricopeptide repeat protein [Saprospiraceae bacterium]HMQ83087.1 tetratricopeptide repeat protein [Saprospiraceae bacterium]
MRNLWLISIFCLSALLSNAQSDKLQQAKEFFFHHQYEEALAVLKGAKELVKTDQEAKFLLAICYFHLNDLNQSSILLKELVKDDSKPAYPECWLYLAKVNHAMHQFEPAIKHYKDYLRRMPVGHPNRSMVWDAIKRCAIGIKLQYLQAGVVVENMGSQVNTADDEFAPIISPSYSGKLYFSSIRPGNIGDKRNDKGQIDEHLGEFRSDMFSCEVTQGQWGKVESMHYLLNSPQHDVLLDFAPGGAILFYFKGNTPESGQILMDTFKRGDDRVLKSDVFSGPINPALGDGTPHFVNDTLIYFSSRRPGGYGGLDLWKTTFSKGQWQTPQNLGSGINTAYDETTPFMARDGRTLYYSTNNSACSVGGLDVVKSVYNEASKRWTDPSNLGIPINSAGDDAFFRVSKDGFTAYFSSSRKDGYGKRDLYIAYFSEFLPEMELILSYNPQGSPIKKESSPVIQKDLAGAPVAVNSNTPPVTVPAVSGFPPIYFQGTDAVLDEKAKAILDKVVASLKKHEGLILVITAFQTGTDNAANRLFKGIQQAELAVTYLNSKGIDQKQVFLRSANAGQVELKSGECALELSFFKPEDFPEGVSLPDLEQGISAAVNDLKWHKNLMYKVQVASLSGAFKGELLDEYEAAMVEKNPTLPYYRYTLGAFSTYAEAETFREKMVKAGQRSAFIVPYIYGIRADKMMARRHILQFPDLKNYDQQ